MSRRPVVPLSFTRHGDASRPAVILLQGLGMASNAWPAELVDALVETGLQVVLPDNRDAGKSPRVTGVRVRDVEVLGAVARTLARRKVSAAYDLDDMADDVAEIRTSPDAFSDVREALEKKGYEFISADVAMVPSTQTALTDPEDLKKMGLLLDHLEEDDDVQNVWHNLENEEDLDR